VVKREVKKFSNGLVHAHYHVPFLKTTTISFYVKAGSIDEVIPDLFGISHFLEHMVFNGSKKYPSRENNDKTIAKLGLYQNAWTWHAQTNYYINGTRDSIPEGYNILIDRVFDPILRDKDIEKEKGIVQEERVMGENNPERALYQKINKIIYEKSSLGHDVIGTKSSIANFNKDILKGYHDTFYSPDNVVLVTYGGMSFDEISSIVDEQLQPLENRQKRYYTGGLETKIEHKPELITVKMDKEVSASFIQDFTIFEAPKTINEMTALLFINTILSEGKSSVLEKKLLLQNSLVSNYDLDIFANGHYINFLFGAATSSEKMEEVQKIYNDVFNNVHEYIDEDSISRAKGFLKGKFLSFIEDPFSVTETDLLNIEYLSQIIKFDINMEDFDNSINSITKEDVLNYLSDLKSVRRAVGYIY